MSLPDYQLLAKQPIYDVNRACVAYELLFRSPMNLKVDDVGAELATNQVLANYCSCISTESEQIAVPVFINLDRQFVLDYRSIPVEADRVVLELTNPGLPDSEMLDAMKEWKNGGFRFALSEYDFSSGMLPFLPVADFVKVDTLSLSKDALATGMKARKGGELIWIAERIENRASYTQCVDWGFDWFQGYFLAEPESVLGSSVRPSVSTTVRLIKELDREDVTIDQIKELVSQDPRLAVQMLKIINSSMFSLPRPVVDLKQAIVFLGTDLLRRWAMILAFLSNGNLHIEVCRLVLLRAKTCEFLCVADKGNVDDAPSAFLAGLVSGVDVLLQVSQEVFLQQVEMTDEINAAVLNKEGTLGQYLDIVLNLEYKISQSHQTVLGLDSDVLGSYRVADAWVNQVINILRT